MAILLNLVKHFPPLSPCDVIVLYVMVARNTIYEFLIHSGLNDQTSSNRKQHVSTIEV